MKNIIKTYAYQNGEKQRVQAVYPESWDSLNFVMPPFSHESFLNLAEFYKKYIVSRYSLLFGTIILFYLPQDIHIEYSEYDAEYGFIYDSLTACTMMFRSHVRSVKGEISISDEKTRKLFDALKERDCLKVIKGRLNTVSILPVERSMGFLSDLPEYSLKTNSAFFTMSFPEISTPYDRIGITVGMLVKNGVVLYPPLYDRPVFTVDKNNTVEIKNQSDFRIRYKIDRIIFHEYNSVVYSRPDYSVTPDGGHDIVIVDNRVVAIKPGGNTPIPAGGYIIKTNYVITSFNDRNVRYEILNDIKFAIQCGNSVMINGERSKQSTSQYYDIRKPWTAPYPPSMYTMNYYKDRAPRMIIGADRKNDPVMLWIEGAGKFGYDRYNDSCGASLNEAEIISERLGLHNAVHMDGGGSAQILYKGKRYLKLSDRNDQTYEEIERGIPLAIYVK